MVYKNAEDSVDMVKKRQTHAGGMVVGSDRPKFTLSFLRKANKRPRHSEVASAGKHRVPQKIIGVLLAVIIVLGGAGYWWLNSQPEDTLTQPAFTARDTSNPKSEVTFFEQQVADMPKENLSSSKKQELYHLYNGLGVAYINNEQLPNAIKAFESALGLADTPDQRRAALSGLAKSYAASGRSADAIATYEKLLALAKAPESGVPNLNIKKYESEMMRLKDAQ